MFQCMMNSPEGLIWIMHVTKANSDTFTL